MHRELQFRSAQLSFSQTPFAIYSSADSTNSDTVPLSDKGCQGPDGAVAQSTPARFPTPPGDYKYWQLLLKRPAATRCPIRLLVRRTIRKFPSPSNSMPLRRPLSTGSFSFCIAAKNCHSEQPQSAGNSSASRAAPAVCHAAASYSKSPSTCCFPARVPAPTLPKPASFQLQSVSHHHTMSQEQLAAERPRPTGNFTVCRTTDRFRSSALPGAHQNHPAGPFSTPSTWDTRFLV